MERKKKNAGENSPENYEELHEVVATCRDCEWQTTGSLFISVQSNVNYRSEILKKCRNHHLEQKPFQERKSNHNTFILKHDRFAQPGIAVLASAATNVMIQLEGNDVPKTNEESVFNLLSSLSNGEKDKKSSDINHQTLD